MNELTLRSGHAVRVAIVATGLSLAGAVAGAGVGLSMTLVTGGFNGPSSIAQVLLAAGAVGAASGAVLFPAGAWFLMRRVPLGRALLWTLLPSCMGAALGLGLFGMTAPVGVVGAMVGFVIAALRLRRSVYDTRSTSVGS